MFFKKFIPADQYRQPSGWLGFLMHKVLDKENSIENDWAINLLAIKPSDIVLEIGFGPGRTLKKIADLASEGHVAGIDFSRRMLISATKLNKKDINIGLVKLILGDAVALPYPNNFFNKIISVYVIYFWQDPVTVLREAHRVLRPGGKIAVLLSAKSAMSTTPLLRNKIFKMYDETELKDIFITAGFRDVVIENKKIRNSEKLCVLATK